MSSPEIVPGTTIPIKRYCTSHKIPHFEAPFKSLKGWNLPDAFDFGIVISFGYFIPARILNCFPKGIVNMHPSLLPKYRGAAPILHTLVNGEPIGGVSIIELHAQRFDAGRILSQVAFPIAPPKCLYAQYEAMIVEKGIAELVQVLAHFPRFQEHAQDQDESAATKAPKITKEFAQISFHAMSKCRIENLYRGIGHLFKLQCNFAFNNKVMQVKLAEIVLEGALEPVALANSTSNAGSVLLDKRQNLLWIKCAGEREWLAVSKLKVEGKNLLYDAKQFAGGYQLRAFEERFT